MKRVIVAAGRGSHFLSEVKTICDDYPYLIDIDSVNYIEENLMILTPEMRQSIQNAATQVGDADDEYADGYADESDVEDAAANLGVVIESIALMIHRKLERGR